MRAAHVAADRAISGVLRGGVRRVGCAALLLSAACGPPTAAPTELLVSRVEVHDPSALAVTFTLQDASHAPTTSDGSLRIVVRDHPAGETGDGAPVCSGEFSVHATSFREQYGWHGWGHALLTPPCVAPEEGHTRDVVMTFTPFTRAALPAVVVPPPPNEYLWVRPPTIPPPAPGLDDLRAWAGTVAVTAAALASDADLPAACPPSTQHTAMLIDEEDVRGLRTVADGGYAESPIRDRQTHSRVLYAIQALQPGARPTGDLVALRAELEAAGDLVWVRRTISRADGRLGSRPHEFEPGLYRGLLYLVDRRAGQVLCGRAFEATNAPELTVPDNASHDLAGPFQQEVRRDLDREARYRADDARASLTGTTLLFEREPPAR